MRSFENIDDFELYIGSILSTIDLSPLFSQIEQIIKSSIEINFKQGGRYGSGKFGGGDNKWIKSKRAIAQSGQTLQDTGSMKIGVGVKVSYNSGQFNITISAGKLYSAVHNFGHSSKPKLPARPFLVLQDEDIKLINELVVEYIVERM
ncbi:MAG: phage virion morphogenesis protein [Candidatus Kapabacteria bacterium]|nr:phage virion morphogenesis protein [Candidatus Kapabacteria bacterium]